MKSVDLNQLTQFVILYCQSKGININPLKLQKLLYYIQAWHIVNFEKDSLFSELPEAWVNGPVYKSVYDKYKTKFFRNDNFKVNYSNDKIIDELNISLNYLGLSKEQEHVLYTVLNGYSPMSDEKLVFLTHRELPWNEARKGLSPIERSSNTISVDSMYNYYSTLLK